MTSGREGIGWNWAILPNCKGKVQDGGLLACSLFRVFFSPFMGVFAGEVEGVTLLDGCAGFRQGRQGKLLLSQEL